MPICEKCRKLSQSVIARQCDDMLCNECDAERIATLEIERQQRQLREATEVSPLEPPPPPPDNSETYVPESQCEGISLVTPGSKGSHDSRVTDHVHSASDSGATVEAAEPPGQTSITSGKCYDKTKRPKSKKSKYIIASVKDCKFNGKKSGGGDFIRCCLCAEWYHEKCVGIKSNESPGVWPYPNCRTMANDVKLLCESVKKLSITELLEMQKASELRQANMEKELQLLKEQNNALCAQNSLLKSQRPLMIYSLPLP